MEEASEKIEQALKVIAKAGDKKLESRARTLDYKDQLREERRRKRLLEKGY